ncbi:hypothetical protein E2C01_056058 [Portunus trituberculatus]|uniref:Uncharacterized protein n=1 Tax=Portunus trituberculatus TaxID=210409 RepID=A0A5B7GWU6_PORTR|nr:hypothetical protein [Portunus trituberculatus]
MHRLTLTPDVQLEAVLDHLGGQQRILGAAQHCLVVVCQRGLELQRGPAHITLLENLQRDNNCS